MSTSASYADKGLSVVVTGWTLTAISAVVVSLRLYTRMTQIRKVGADDYFMICSLVRQSHCSMLLEMGIDFIALWTDTCGIPHHCMAAGLGKPFRLLDSRSTTGCPQADHRWCRAILDCHESFWTYLFLHLPLARYLSSGYGKKQNPVVNHWHTGCCELCLSRPDLCSMRQQS